MATGGSPHDPFPWDLRFDAILLTEAELLEVLAEAGLRVLDLRQAPGCGYGHFNLVLAAA